MSGKEDQTTKEEAKNYLVLMVKTRKLFGEFLAEVKKDQRVKKGSPWGIATAIAEKIGVSYYFVLRHTNSLIDESIFVDNEAGTWEDNQDEQYINTKYLRRELALSKPCATELLRKGGVPSVLIWTNVKRNRPQKFYKLAEVRWRVPVIRKKLDELEERNALPEGNLFKSRPLNLKRSHYEIFCALLKWKNKLDYWPTNRELSYVPYREKYSVNYIKEVIRKLKRKGYISVSYENNLNSGEKLIVVHRGPEQLITKECNENGKVVRVDREYVKRRKVG